MQTDLLKPLAALRLPADVDLFSYREGIIDGKLRGCDVVAVEVKDVCAKRFTRWAAQRSGRERLRDQPSSS